MYEISLDTETTGLDLHHGARPFLVTTALPDNSNLYWEWDVCPHTRRVHAPTKDLEDVISLVEKADAIYLQNSKFDVAMLAKLLPEDYEWPWEKVWDTLVSGHLLASGRRHDLTTMSIEYLGVDPTATDDRCKAVVQACRRLVRRKNSPCGDWRIAQKGLPEMPSAKETVWKYDLWLPRAMVKAGIITDPLEVENCLECVPEYANTDSVCTLEIGRRHRKEVSKRGLTKIMEQRMELIPVVHKMEGNGVTLHAGRLDKLVAQYKEESNKERTRCENIAKLTGYELELPKSGMNNSLREFCFDVLRMPVLKRTNSGGPSLDKEAMEMYKTELLPRSKQARFLSSLSNKRKRDTAINYMEAYRRFWLSPRGHRPASPWRILFPSLNPMGSDTLRFGSSNPNEQNISKKEGFNLRYCYGPLPGREWWSKDAKNIELRIPAYESGEPLLIALFEKPDEAPYYGSTHLLNFSTVYPDIWQMELEEVGIESVGPHCKKKYASTWYQRCKNGGFAVQYGAVRKDLPENKQKDRNEWGTADKAFGRYGCHAKLEERFGRLKELNQKQITMANELGYVETMPDRSIDPDRGYPLQCERNQWGRVKPTIPLSYHVQGTAMWWMTQAMIRCQAVLDSWDFPAYMVMQVHDEIVFDLPQGIDEQHTLQLVKAMEQGGDDIGVPTPVGAERHEATWDTGVTVL